MMRFASRKQPVPSQRSTRSSRQSSLETALPRLTSQRHGPVSTHLRRTENLLLAPHPGNNPPVRSDISCSSGINSRLGSNPLPADCVTPKKSDPDVEWSPQLSGTLHDHYDDKKEAAASRGSSKRLRTPRTLTRLMQQHRDNERHRHRGLNASIKEITKFIPGYSDACNETKIGKLQRIIHYICHMEEHIQNLCQDVGLELQFKNLFLSPHITTAEGSGTATYTSIQGKAMSAAKIKHIPAPRKYLTKARISRSRQKISSPTIDSTTDVPLPWGQGSEGSSSLSQTSPDDCASSSTLDPAQLFGACHSSASFFGSTSAEGSQDTLPWSMSGSDTDPGRKLQTPVCSPHSEWNSGVAAEEFLSPETANFLQSKGYDKVVDDFDFSGAFQKIEDECQSTTPSFTTIKMEDLKDLVEAGASSQGQAGTEDTGWLDSKQWVDNKDWNNTKETEFIEYIPLSLEDEPVFDIEVSTDNNLPPHNNNMDSLHVSNPDHFQGSPLEIPNILSDSSLAGNLQLECYDVGNHGDVDDDQIHIMSHMEGVDLSDGELETTQVPLPTTAPVRVEKIEQVLAHDDMYASRLQNIEEDDNDYLSSDTIDKKLFEFSPLGSSPDDKHTSSKTSRSPLFALSKLLTDAGLSPQCLKYGDHEHGLGSPFDSPDDQHKVIREHTSKSPRPRAVEQEEPRASTSTEISSDPKRASIRDTSPVQETHLVVKRIGGGLLTTYKVRGPCCVADVSRDLLQQFDAESVTVQTQRPQHWRLRTGSRKDSHSHTTKVDHRRTSWMNGFMMYSRLHRKEYIEANPGSQASQISRLLGQDWRRLSPAQQEPYREKARAYVQDKLLAPGLGKSHV